jgi:hypothetical protein
VTDQTRSSHVDKDSLECVRDFLHREFRGGRHEDYFDPVKAVQVFRIDGTRGLHHTLIIPRATFEHADFGLLCNAHLLDALRGAGDVPVILTPDGVDIVPAALTRFFALGVHGTSSRQARQRAGDLEGGTAPDVAGPPAD